MWLSVPIVDTCLVGFKRVVIVASVLCNTINHSPPFKSGCGCQEFELSSCDVTTSGLGGFPKTWVSQRAFLDAFLFCCIDLGARVLLPRVDR